MARTESEALVVALEARITQFEKNFTKANRTANTNFKAIEGRAQQSATRLEQAMGKATGSVTKQFNAMGKSMLVALGVGGGIGGIAALVKESLSAADAIGKAADRAGVGVEAFQRLSFAADLAGVSSQQLEESLGQLNKRMAEGKVEGAGTEDALLRVAEQVKNASSASERAAIVNAAFGEQGRKLLPFLQQGAAGIKSLTDEATRLGLVLDEKTIRGAEALNDELTRMTAVARTNIQSGILSGLVRDSEGLRAVYSDPAFKDGLRTFGKFIGESLGFIVRNADVIIRTMKALGAIYIGAKIGGAIGGKRGAVLGGAVGAGMAGVMEMMREGAADMEESVARMNDALSNFGGGNAVDIGGENTGLDKLLTATKAARFELELLESGLDDVGQEALRTMHGFGLMDSIRDVSPNQQAVDDYTIALDRLRRAQEDANKATDDQKKGKAIWDSTRTAAEEYAATLEELNRLWAEGAIDAETHRRALAKADEDLKKETEKTNETIAEFGQITASAFEDAILAGNELRGVVQGLAQDIARMLLRKAVTVPITNMFGNFLGGLVPSADGNAFMGGKVVPMARGGMGSSGILRQPTAFPMRSGDVALGGELRDEAILPLRRLAKGQLGVGAAQSGGGNQTIINAPITVNVEGGSNGPEADTDLANKIGKRVNEMIDQRFAQNLQTQMRPGNMLNPNYKV